MIDNFQELTAPITDEEKVIAYKLLDALGMGSGNALKSYQLEKRFGIKGVQVRKFVNFLRRTQTKRAVLATTKGYYISTDKAEIRRFIDSMRQRSEAIKVVADSMEDCEALIL